MTILNKNQCLNYLALDLLEKLGNNDPAEEEVSLMEKILTEVSVTQRFSFNRRLTKREVSCLYWAAMGKTSKETAQLLAIKASTVEQYRKVIKRKLECKSMAEAVFKGMQLNYVHTILGNTGS